MIEGLKACCGAVNFHEPFRFEWSGATWVGATNGSGMAAIQTDDPEVLAAANGRSLSTPSAYDVLAANGEGEPAAISALRAWCNEESHTKPCPDCNGTRRAKCSECKGTGRIEHECDCPHCHIDDGPCEECGGEREYDCEECDDGKVAAMVPGVIAGAVFDRALLAKVLASAPGETVMMYLDGDRLNLEAPWWRGAIMRLRNAPDGLSVFCCPAPDDSPRDKVANPRMGDWFFDAHGWVRRVDSAQPGRVVYTAWGSLGDGKAEREIEYDWAQRAKAYGFRPMTPDEVEAFERDGTRPECS